jgi:predicted transcriptional regulator
MSVSREKKLLNGRRSDVQIIVGILEVALHGAGKTEVVYKANLNFGQAKKYMSFLMDNGLLSTVASSNGSNKYQTTEKGKLFVKRYRETLDSIQ